MHNSGSFVTNEQASKNVKLRDILKSYGSAAVAFSGGVDSTFLLYTAHEVLGEKVVAITAKSCSFPQRELSQAVSFCSNHGITHVVIESEEMDIPHFRENPRNRCYLCKKELFSKMKEEARKMGLAVVSEGSNMDDVGDYRPGLQAIAELNISSPLREAGLYKDDIRLLSAMYSLPTASKPSFACLSSRFPYGEEITEEKLGMVDRSEAFLLDLGFIQVRVRIHGMLARIEILPDQFPKIMEEKTRQLVYDTLIKYGFTYVCLDLKGYRTGSMNEGIKGDGVLS